MDFQALIRSQHRALRRKLERLAEHCGPQDVHEARVAVRRLRTLLSALSSLIPPPLLAQLSECLKSIADDLGTTRDVDVRCELLRPILRDRDRIDPSAARAITLSLQTQRRHARRAMLRGLRSAALHKTQQLIDEHGFFAAGSTSADALLGKALERRWKKVARGIRKRSDKPAKRHALRVQVKKCRYLVDARGRGAMNGESAKVLARLHELQNCLGELNDLTQTRRWLKAQRFPTSASKALKISLRRQEQRAESDLKHLHRKFRGIKTRCLALGSVRRVVFSRMGHE